MTIEMRFEMKLIKNGIDKYMVNFEEKKLIQHIQMRTIMTVQYNWGVSHLVGII